MAPSSLDPSAFPTLAVFGLIAIATVIGFFVYGFAMKWSLSLAGCGQFGFGWSLLISIAACIVSNVVVLCAAQATGSESILVPSLYGFVVASVVIAMMTKSNPIFASLACFLFMIFGTIGSIGTATVLALMMIPFMGSVSSDNASTSLAEQLQNATLRSGSAEVLRSDDDGQQNAVPGQLNPQSRLKNVFFKSETTAATQPPPPAATEPSPVQTPKPQRSGIRSSGNRKRHAETGVQSNPFVK